MTVPEADFFVSPQSLGRPIPLDEHAVSVSLPTWADVVGYEEGEKRVTDSMRIGYPRFKVHACIEKLIESVKLRNNIDSSCHDCIILPSKSAANVFIKFLGESGHESFVSEVGYLTMQAVFYPVTMKGYGKKFWQHTGEIISSRLAEDALLSMNLGLSCNDWGVTASHSADGARHSASDLHMADFKQLEQQQQSSSGESALDTVLHTIKSRISSIIQEPAEQITVCVSGMAAIYGALKCVQELGRQSGNTPGSIVVFGFPYLDTLKLMQLEELNPEGCTFLGTGESADLDLLEHSLRVYSATHTGYKQGVEGRDGGPTGGVSAVFTEFPSNPLLKCPDLHRLTALAFEFNFLLVVDDTIGNFENLDLFHSEGVRADIVCSSLTKIFSGRGDVLAGSLIINSHTHIDSTSSSPPPSDKRAARARQLVDIAGSLDLPALYLADAVTLERNSRDFLQRCALVNQTGRALAEWLRDQRGVGDLFYSAGEEYESVMRNKGMAGERVSGYGCLMSLVLLPEWDEKTFFDCLAVAKGPSLGTNFTIACPYTLLAHYLELDWANQYGVDRRLIRISVGLENLDTLKAAFSEALQSAQPSSPRCPL